MKTTTPRFFTRELSWLEFNQRVLEEASDPTVPLLERLKFLAITGSNLDEFFMVRVGGLQQIRAEGGTRRDPSGLTPAELLACISDRAHRLAADQYACYMENLEPALRAAGVRRVLPSALTAEQGAFLQTVMDEMICSVVSPIAVRAAAEMPLLVNLCLHVAVRLKPDPGGPERKPRFAVIPVGLGLDRFVTLPSPEGGYAYLLVEDLVTLLADRLFPGEPVAEAVPFRITRNADLSVREDQAADLLAEMQEVLDARLWSDCVRLEVGRPISKALLGFLQRTLKVRDEDVYSIPGPLDLSAFMRLGDLNGFDELKNETWNPCPPARVDPARSVFETLADGDLLLCHPFESFDPVVRLVEEAADDPDVIAIKQILYRTSKNSPVVAALMRAADRGKYVTAIVELKARFDEARNIEWARALEQSRVQVVYGIRNLKTHAKVCIVVRREPQGLRRYLHFGTGNYNERTARLYTDVSYMTTDPDLGADAAAFFNAITGYSQPQRYRRLEMAPLGLRDKLLELIGGETERRRQGLPARILAKMNSLVDPRLIKALYEASQAGVDIALNVRGVCCLRPGVPGLSERIRVVSIVDRFLEHSRVFCFHQGGEDRVFISSADWMPRNLDRRIELLVPVVDPACRDRLIHLLETCLADNVKGRLLQPDGSYRRQRPAAGERALRSQEVLFAEAGKANAEARRRRLTVFEPHRPPTNGE